MHGTVDGYSLVILVADTLKNMRIIKIRNYYKINEHILRTSTTRIISTILYFKMCSQKHLNGEFFTCKTKGTEVK